MRLRILDLLLIGIILVGSFFAVRSGLERQRLSKTFERLSRKTGDLVVADPSKAYIQALPTQEPLHFAWRVYLPPNYSVNLRSHQGSLSSFRSSSAVECIARIRFREDKKGDLNVYIRFVGGSSRSTLGDASFAKLLHGRWENVQVKQLGTGQPAVFGADQTVVLLQLNLPEELRPEALKTISPHLHEQFIPVFFKAELGPAQQVPIPPGSTVSSPSPGV